MSETLPGALRGRSWLLPTAAVTRSKIMCHDELVTVVRDDLLHPFAGGNKLRKLDGWLPQLINAGADAVVTCGGVQSAHCAAVAVLCAERGLRPHVFLRGEPLDNPTGYNLITHLYADVRYVDRDTYADRSFLSREAATLREGGLNVAEIPEGGGGINALYGLIRLVHGLMLRTPDPYSEKLELVVDAGTGTTAAGLALAVRLLELPWKVDAVCLMRDQLETYQRHAQSLWDQWADAEGAPIHQPEIVWNERGRPRRFGDVLDGELEKCVTIARETGVLLDPIYTLAAWESIEARKARHRRKCVLIHTGGTFNNFSIFAREKRNFKPAPPQA